MEDESISEVTTQQMIQLSAEIVSAYVEANTLPANELADLIKDIHTTLCELGSDDNTPSNQTTLRPLVSVKKSIMPDYIICLEDGKKFQSLKRHLRSQYNLTPDEYRKKWGLPATYPMVAPNYAKKRSQLAKKMGLGKNRD